MNTVLPSPPQPEEQLGPSETLNRQCFCLTLDQDALSLGAPGRFRASRSLTMGLKSNISTKFLLFQQLFERHGLRSVIAAPAALEWRDSELTKRVWQDILAGDYVAQSIVLPGKRLRQC